MVKKRPFKVFSDAESAVWRVMFERQIPQVKEHATKLWLDGIDKIGLTAERIPDFAQLNQRFKELVGWELVSTDVQYSNGQDWFEALARKEFLITEYIRDMKDLEYTPLPDIFHDAFGHLPFMADQRYADYIHRFAMAALQYTPEGRKSLGSLWWYTIEFGFLRVNGELKALGAGLMSSVAELKRAYSDQVQRVPYSLAEFECIDPSPHVFHDKLFILDSYDQLEHSVDDWVAAHPPRELAH
jgi:phenylalanine-4-hydroxylase